MATTPEEATILPTADDQPAPASPFRGKAPKAGIALCLSGGGYRAMLFHVGALWRLNEWGYLPRLNEVSSVSGGSITAALLGLRWSTLDFDAHGVAANFTARIAAPLIRMAGRTIDIPAALPGFFVGGLAARRIATAYRHRDLFGEATLQSLPDTPVFTINALNMQSGALWRFRKAEMADYRVGSVKNPQVPLAVAVAASTAFPPFLSPLILDLKGMTLVPARRAGSLTTPPYTEQAFLTDGGVYDNLGLQPVWDTWDTVLISDGGRGLAPEPRPQTFWPLQLVRITTLLDNQVRARRRTQAITAFQLRNLPPPDGATTDALFRRTTRRGTYWHVSQDPATPHVRDTLPCPPEQTAKLANVVTTLRYTPMQTRHRIINWGYAACDMRMRTHIDPTLPPPTGFPFPPDGVG